MPVLSRQIAVALLLIVAVSARAQDLPGLLDGLGGAASDVIGGGDVMIDLDLGDVDVMLEVELLDTPLSGGGADGGTDLLLLGAPSGDDTTLQAENVDLLADDSVGSDLDAFNTEFDDGSVLRVNSSGEANCADGDRDRVCDGRDECPRTPKGQLVMPNGCALDLQTPLPSHDLSGQWLPIAANNVRLIAELGEGFVTATRTL